jgi:predicted nucleic acid-binding protein
LKVHLDTSVVIDAFTSPFRSRLELRALVADGHRPAISTPVLYEWLRGPRLEVERVDQEAVLPVAETITFDAACAQTAARLYRDIRRPRGREVDIAIAACAIEHGAALWTLNPADFGDIPGLKLYSSPRR